MERVKKSKAEKTNKSHLHLSLSCAKLKQRKMRVSFTKITHNTFFLFAPSAYSWLSWLNRAKLNPPSRPHYSPPRPDIAIDRIISLSNNEEEKKWKYSANAFPEISFIAPLTDLASNRYHFLFTHCEREKDITLRLPEIRRRGRRVFFCLSIASMNLIWSNLLLLLLFLSSDVNCDQVSMEQIEQGEKHSIEISRKAIVYYS